MTPASKKLDAATDAPVNDTNDTLILEEGKEYEVKITGFNFVRDYVSITGIYRGQKLSGIIGRRDQFTIRDLKDFGGLNVLLQFKEVGYSASGTEYNRFQVNGFAGLKD
jgi:hypothetical protein